MVNLQPVIDWLERGCDPKEAAKELRIYQSGRVDPGYLRTMGKIAQVGRCLVGGRDENGFPVPQPGIEDIGRLLGQLRALLDEYDRQMIEATRDE